MPTLETHRLWVRRFTRADVDVVASLHDDCFCSGPRAAREAWLDWTVLNYAALEQLRQPPYGDYAIALKETGEVVGSVGLVPTFGPFESLPSFRARLREEPARREHFTPEMGLFWAVAAAHRRRGYASEAATALAQFAFYKLCAARLVATTEHANAASIAVMKRLGMSVERNPQPKPPWFQTVGILFKPDP
jgi:RimJ/RimL family protein N-acetyltransferase